MVTKSKSEERRWYGNLHKDFPLLPTMIGRRQQEEKKEEEVKNQEKKEEEVKNQEKKKEGERKERVKSSSLHGNYNSKQNNIETSGGEAANKSRVDSEKEIFENITADNTIKTKQLKYPSKLRDKTIKDHKIRS
ncbi:Hypothetical predicted protein [Octopus vulgaris]|uniref:Uncharacterized protein n=1 Tax=Octopus vulgaris TaxID=6645 RepID=A0AA36BGJ8_OCTVU|nr:Hypothetical predicted protein [Octopus vulgaris]CAI9733664.1 Hypothetical predicted protein [Octopus vulgaris]